MKRAAGAGLAFDPDLPAHQTHQCGRDGQTEACGPEAAGRRPVGPTERFENRRVLFRGDADAGVADDDVQHGRLVATRILGHFEDDVPVCREFDRITDKVHHCLAQPHGIPDEARRHLGANVVDEIESFLRGPDGEQLHRVRDQRPRRERDRLQLELLRFALQRAQYLTEDREQRIGRRLHRRQIVPLFRGQFSVERQLDQARDAAHEEAAVMARPGQELRFHADQLHRRVTRLLNVRLDALPLRVSRTTTQTACLRPSPSDSGCTLRR
jgi:hypothetical protein